MKRSTGRVIGDTGYGKRKNHEKPYGSMAVWIVVTETELNGARRMYDWQPFAVEGDGQAYFESNTADGRRLILARQNEMGMTACAALCEKCIWQFRPKYLIMVGITAGTVRPELEDQEYGDVIVADVAGIMHPENTFPLKTGISVLEILVLSPDPKK